MPQGQKPLCLIALQRGGRRHSHSLLRSSIFPFLQELHNTAARSLQEDEDTLRRRGVQRGGEAATAARRADLPESGRGAKFKQAVGDGSRAHSATAPAQE